MLKTPFKITVCLLLYISGVFSTEPFNYYDDDYYYDYDYKEPASKVQSEDYDLSELVKAWKEYIKEKNFEEKNYECNPKDDSYRTPDSNQCDRYVECRQNLLRVFSVVSTTNLEAYVWSQPFSPHVEGKNPRFSKLCSFQVMYQATFP